MSDESNNVLQPSEENELERCKKQCDEYLAGWQRAKADLINYKRDESARLQEIAQYATNDLLEEFIGVLRSFDLGLAALEKEGSVQKGVYLIRSQIEDILKKHGLTKIEIKIGEPFDPRTQEAILEGDPPSPPAGGAGYPPGTVLEEIESGYRLYDKILRPTKVKIAKEKGQTIHNQIN